MQKRRTGFFFAHTTPTYPSTKFKIEPGLDNGRSQITRLIEPENLIFARRGVRVSELLCEDEGRDRLGEASSRDL